MKISLGFLLVALFSYLGTASAHDREAEIQHDINEAKMFGFLLQGILCLYNEAWNGPLDKKAAAYKKIIPHVVGFVNTYAASRDTSPNDVFLEQNTYAASRDTSPNDVFLEQNDFNLFLELQEIAKTGHYTDVKFVEITSDGLFLGMGKAMVSNMESLGMSAADALHSVTGILGGTTNAAGNLPHSFIRIFGGLMAAPAQG